MYLGKTILDGCDKPVVVVTSEYVSTNDLGLHSAFGPSTQEEADTLMIRHGVGLARTGQVDFCTKDTDCWKSGGGATNLLAPSYMCQQPRWQLSLPSSYLVAFIFTHR